MRRCANDVGNLGRYWIRALYRVHLHRASSRRVTVKVNRKSTPKMVVRPYFTSEYQRLEREAHNRERFSFTVAVMAFWVLAVLVFQLVSR